MDTWAGIPESASQNTPLAPRTKFCQVRGADGSVLGLLSSDVCKVNNTDECWWLLMRICIQFKSRVFKAPEKRTTFSQGYCASLLDCLMIFPQWYTILNNIERMADIAVTSVKQKHILFVVYWLINWAFKIIFLFKMHIRKVHEQFNTLITCTMKIDVLVKEDENWHLRQQLSLLMLRLYHLRQNFAVCIKFVS